MSEISLGGAAIPAKKLASNMAGVIYGGRRFVEHSDFLTPGARADHHI